MAAENTLAKTEASSDIQVVIPALKKTIELYQQYWMDNTELFNYLDSEAGRLKELLTRLRRNSG
jgi:hypothetical protein